LLNKNLNYCWVDVHSVLNMTAKHL